MMTTKLRGALFVALAWASCATLWADDQSHRQAAEKLLDATNVAKTMDAMINQSLDAQIKANPQLAPQKEVLKKFLSKYLSYSAMKSDLVNLYVEEFTEDELNQLAAFYQTPVGKKAAEKLPTLAAKGAQLGVAKVQANQAELIKMIQDNMANPAAK